MPIHRFRLHLLVFCIACLAALPASARHPIHASITTIDLNPKTHSFEIDCKIFADDLEEVIRKTTGTQLYIGSAKENPKQTNAKIEESLRSHFRVEADGKALQWWTFVGRELEGDVVWCYLEVQNVPTLKRLLVSNTALHDLHDDQTNLVNVPISGACRSAGLRRGKEVETLEF